MDTTPDHNPANKALAIGSEIKQIVVGTPLEKDAMILGAMFTSGYFKDLTSLSKAITKALIGQQMGMGLVESMNSLYVIDGRVAMDSHAIRNQAIKGGYIVRTIELTDEKCVLEWRFKDEVLGNSEFTWADAQAAGLANKSNWKAYRKDMLLARATTRGARMYGSQAFANQPVYEREEIIEGSLVDDVAPTDERAEAIRIATTPEELAAAVATLSTEEKRAMADTIAVRMKEVADAAQPKK